MASKDIRKEKSVEVVPDYLMWVGSIYYPTVDDFIAEARKLGPCKRLGKLPRGLTIGKSKIFLAHDDGLVGDGFIFGYFIPNAIEYLTVSENEIPMSVFERVVYKNLGSAASEKVRMCGYRKEGMYVSVSPEYKEVDGKFVVFNKPRRLEDLDPGRTRFRGLLRITFGKAILKAKAEFTMIPPSRGASLLPKHDWTSEEDERIMKTMGKGKTLARTAQELAYEFGRSKTAILYRYRKLLSHLD